MFAVYSIQLTSYLGIDITYSFKVCLSIYRAQILFHAMALHAVVLCVIWAVYIWSWHSEIEFVICLHAIAAALKPYGLLFLSLCHAKLCYIRAVGFDCYKKSLTIYRASDTHNGYGVRECDAQPKALVAPYKWKIDSYLCVTDTKVLHMRTAAWTHGR